ncbi:MAG: Crp/Fnr family transcriptional regulator [Cellvibrionaceae bacterium]|nr:Crp/Fnr family transcriptional regulator [Cellvibrionaceae bacterium]
MNSKTCYLRKIKALEDFTASQLERIAPRFKYKEITAKQLIVHSGEHTNEVYFIVGGTVRATQFTPSGSEVAYQDLEVGEMFGELAAIDEQQRTTDVIALVKTELLWLSRSDFIQLIETTPEFTWGVLKRMSYMNRFLCARVFEYSALNVRSRIRAELIRLYEKSGRLVDGVAFVENPPKHQELANRLATHREAVTRELNDLQKKNLIKKERNLLVFLDLEALQSIIWQ